MAFALFSKQELSSFVKFYLSPCITALVKLRCYARTSRQLLFLHFIFCRLDSDDADSDEMEAKANELDRLVKEQKPELDTEKGSRKGVCFNERPLGPAKSSPLIQEIPMDEPQSILKHTDHVPRVDRQAVEAMDRRDQTVILPESQSAFKGPIVERDPLAMLNTPSTIAQPTTQKQSKFKARHKN